MLIGYMRVSKADGSQVLDLQRDALLGAGIPSDCLYEDHASGKRDDRPGLDACLKSLRKGDTLVAWKLDRIGRDLRHLVNLVHDLTKRGVGLRVLAGEGAAIDTTTANGRLMFGFFAALAEFERELIVERTKAGLASARARGRNGGRPFKMTTAKLRLAQAAMDRYSQWQTAGGLVRQAVRYQRWASNVVEVECVRCQSALNSFQVTASKSFHFVSPVSPVFCVV